MTNNLCVYLGELEVVIMKTGHKNLRLFQQYCSKQQLV